MSVWYFLYLFEFYGNHSFKQRSIAEENERKISRKASNGKGEKNIKIIKKKAFDLSLEQKKVSPLYIKYRILIVKTRAATYCYVALPFYSLLNVEQQKYQEIRV